MGQAWQRNEYYKIVDAQEHGRRMASTSMSYAEYKRRIEAAKDTKQARRGRRPGAPL